MELVLDKFREEHDKFIALNEELELAAKAQEQAEKIMSDAKENFNAVLEVTFSEHKQEIQALGKQYDSKVYALEAKLKVMRDQSYEESKRVESANARVVTLENELEEVRSKMELSLIHI